MIMFDWSINVGHILTIVALLVGGLGLVYTIRGRVDAITQRILIIEIELKRLVDVLIQQSRQEERLAAMDARLVNQGARLDELLRRYNNKLDLESKLD